MARTRMDQSLIGDPRRPVLLHHLWVYGSQVEIGRTIGEIAIERGVRPETLLSDGRFVRARRSYFDRSYPLHAHRMQGVAAAFDLRPDDDRFDFSVLPVGGPAVSVDALEGSAAYSPPWSTPRGHGFLEWSGRLPLIGERELYLVEWRPRGRARASLALHAFDLLSGTVAGINSEGVVVAAVAVGRDAPAGFSRDGALWPPRAVGLHEFALLRWILDTCGTVDDAQDRLLAARTFRMVLPTLALVADGSGRSFAYRIRPDGGLSILVGEAEQLIASGATRRPRIGGSGTADVVEAMGASILGRSRDGPPEEPWTCVLDPDRCSLQLHLGPGGADAAGSDGPIMASYIAAL